MDHRSMRRPTVMYLDGSKKTIGEAVLKDHFPGMEILV